MGKEKKGSADDKKIIASESSIIKITILVSALMITAAFGGYLVGASKIAEHVIIKRQTEEKMRDNYREPQQSSSGTTTEQQEVIKPLDLTKSLNTTNITYSNANEKGEDLGLSIKTDGTNTKLVIDYKKFCKYSFSTACSTGTEEREIRGINGKVKSGFIGGNGQDYTGTVLYYLLEDGTVEYTRLYAKKQDNYGNYYYVVNNSYDEQDGRIVGDYYKNQGKISGVQNVIKLYTVNASVERGGGYVTTIAATKDGSFYDLGHILNSN